MFLELLNSLKDSIWDFLVFILVMILTTVLPLWGSIFKIKQKSSKAEYVFAAGSSIPIISIMLSVARGTLGVKSFLGYPSELFYRGSAMWETLYGLVNAYPLICLIFIPVYFSLGITSIYQYLDLRFNSKLVRCLASGTYILRSILNLGVTIYTPTVALYTMAGLPIWLSLLGITLISAAFNLIGGLKASVKADVIQMLITVIVSLLIIVQSTILAGGFGKIYETNKNNGRLNFLNFTGDFTVRVDTTSAWIGQLFMSLSLLGCQQKFVQRYLSMKNKSQVNKMLLLNIPVIVVCFSLSWIVGMAIYTVYSGCDPLKSGLIDKPDAILPFYFKENFAIIPGLMGLFLATLFNSALILNVSNINALATVTWEDFFRLIPKLTMLKDKKQLVIIKFLGTIYALIIFGVGFLIQFLPGIIESSMLVTSVTSGPLLGVFLLAMFVPFANSKGAVTGMVSSHMIIFIITYGHLRYAKVTQLLDTSIESCSNSTMLNTINQSKYFAQNVTLNINQSDFPEIVYSISYMYYSFIGTFITVLIGSLVSCCFRSESDKYDKKLLHPIISKICAKIRSIKVQS